MEVPDVELAVVVVEPGEVVDEDDTLMEDDVAAATPPPFKLHPTIENILQMMATNYFACVVTQCFVVVGCLVVSVPLLEVSVD